MNRMIRAAAQERDRGDGGLVERLWAKPLAEERRVALGAALADAERAIKRGDNSARSAAEERIEAILNQGQEVATPAEPVAVPVRLDGGARRSVPRHSPPGMTSLIAGEIAARRAMGDEARAIEISVSAGTARGDY